MLIGLIIFLGAALMTAAVGLGLREVKNGYYDTVTRETLKKYKKNPPL